jgi:hypothetical protein
MPVSIPRFPPLSPSLPLHHHAVSHAPLAVRCWDAAAVVAAAAAAAAAADDELPHIEQVCAYTAYSSEYAFWQSPVERTNDSAINSSSYSKL